LTSDALNLRRDAMPDLGLKWVALRNTTGPAAATHGTDLKAVTPLSPSRTEANGRAICPTVCPTQRMPTCVDMSTETSLADTAIRFRR